MPAVSQVRAWLLDLQQRITSACSEIDGKAFLADACLGRGSPLLGAIHAVATALADVDGYVALFAIRWIADERAADALRQLFA